MSVRIRANGRILCAAVHPAEPGDAYLDDGIHYGLSVLAKTLVAAPDHAKTGEWWWCWNVPQGQKIDEWWRDGVPDGVEGPSPVASGDFDAYERERDLPKLIPIYCRHHDIEDHSELVTERIVAALMKLAVATFGKVTSAQAHRTCELSQLLAVVSALKAEKRNLSVIVSRQAAALSTATAGPRETRGTA